MFVKLKRGPAGFPQAPFLSDIAYISNLTV